MPLLNYIAKVIVPIIVALLLAACGSEEPATVIGRDLTENRNASQFLTDSPIGDGRHLAPELASAISAGPAKEFPGSLSDEATELPRDEVLSQWTSFLSDSYVVDISGSVTEYCADGTGSRFGTVLVFINQPGTTFEEFRTGTFEWSLEPPSQDGAWNLPVLREDNNRKNLTLPDGYLFPGWAFSTNRLAVFENPTCGQSGLETIPSRVPALWGVDTIKEFPTELLPGAEPLPWDEVIKIWINWRNDTMLISDDGLVMEFCRGGTGNTLARPFDPIDQPEPFKWSFHPNRGHPWNQPRFVYANTGSDSDVFRGTLKMPEDGRFHGPNPNIEVLWFEHPNCGNTPVFERGSLQGEDPSEVIQGARNPETR